MSSHDLFSVAVRAVALWFISLGIIALFSIVAGPFATLIVGLLPLAYSRALSKRTATDV
jgi:hypothetical protein